MAKIYWEAFKKSGKIGDYLLHRIVEDNDVDVETK